MSNRPKIRAIWSWLILILGVIWIAGLSRTVWRLWQAKGRLDEAQKRLDELKAEGSRLREESEYVQSKEFIEGEVRDKLNMSYPDETTILLPPNVGRQVEQSNKSAITVKVPWWKRCWERVFGTRR